jgi:hypothetical protein
MPTMITTNYSSGCYLQQVSGLVPSEKYRGVVDDNDYGTRSGYSAEPILRERRPDSKIQLRSNRSVQSHVFRSSIESQCDASSIHEYREHSRIF